MNAQSWAAEESKARVRCSCPEPPDPGLAVSYAFLTRLPRKTDTDWHTALHSSCCRIFHRSQPGSPRPEATRLSELYFVGRDQLREREKSLSQESAGLPEVTKSPQPTGREELFIPKNARLFHLFIHQTDVQVSPWLPLIKWLG